MCSLRDRIYEAISRPACDRCKERRNWNITDCYKYKCHDLYKQETDTVMAIVREYIDDY